MRSGGAIGAARSDREIRAAFGHGLISVSQLKLHIRHCAYTRGNCCGEGRKAPATSSAASNILASASRDHLRPREGKAAFPSEGNLRFRERVAVLRVGG